MLRNLHTMWKCLSIWCCIMLFGLLAQAQPATEHNLAIQYYREGDFAKAATLFETLYKDNPQAEYYYRYYYNCLIRLEDYTTLEKVVKRAMRQRPGDQTYRIDLGYVLSQTGDVSGAYALYQEAIDQMPASRSEVLRVAGGFNNIREYEWAIKAYEQGRKMVRDYSFYYELANLYRTTGNGTQMVNNYLNYLLENPQQQQTVQNVLQDYMDQDDLYKETQRILYDRLQRNPDVIMYNELLIWVFTQRKDFDAALVQAKALDRRLQEDGMRIYNLARAALDEKQYDAAIRALEYLIAKGNTSNFYFFARERLLEVRYEKITEQLNYSAEELQQLKAAYQSFMQEFGQNRVKAAYTAKALANLEAFYLHQLDSAITIMEQLVYSTPGLSTTFLSECKLDLGDYYLMDGDIWEATLLYSQVDKSMKDEPLGEMARFKNAKLTYYRGDFPWAQGQLDVLKGSTSELIANDALDLSVFITANLGLDTSSQAMWQFARADLLMFQNKIPEALRTLDSIITTFPDHVLLDDIYLLKARVSMQLQDFPTALDYLKKITTQYNDKLLLDDAYFLMGKLYEEVLSDKELAMEQYQKIMLDFQDSIYVLEARERFRKLRGDTLN